MSHDYRKLPLGTPLLVRHAFGAVPAGAIVHLSGVDYDGDPYFRRRKEDAMAGSRRHYIPARNVEPAASISPREQRGWHMDGNYAVEISHAIERMPEDVADYFGGRKASGYCATRQDGIPAKIKATVRLVRDASALDGHGMIQEVDAIRRVIDSARNNRTGEGIAAWIGEQVLGLLGPEPHKGLVELTVKLGNGNDLVEWSAPVAPKPIALSAPGDFVAGPIAAVGRAAMAAASAMAAEETAGVAGIPGLPEDVVAAGGPIASLGAWLHAALVGIAARDNAIAEQVNETAAAAKAIEAKVIPDDFEDQEDPEDDDSDDEDEDDDSEEDDEDYDSDDEDDSDEDDDSEEPFEAGEELRVLVAFNGWEVGDIVYFVSTDSDGDAWVSRSKAHAEAGGSDGWLPVEENGVAYLEPTGGSAAPDSQGAPGEWRKGAVAVAKDGNGSKLGAGDPFLVFDGPDADGQILALPLSAPGRHGDEPDPDLAYWIPAADLEVKPIPTFEAGAKVKLARLVWRFHLHGGDPRGAHYADHGTTAGSRLDLGGTYEVLHSAGVDVGLDDGDGGWLVSPWSIELAE